MADGHDHPHPHPHPHQHGPPQGQPQTIQITPEQLKQLTPQQLQQLAQLQQQQRMMQQQQQQQAPRPDPVMQSIIDADYKPVPLKLGEPSNQTVLCAPHGLEVCADCGTDFTQLNLLTKALVNRPDLAFPPPPHIVHPARSVAVTKTKDEGNNHFKAGRYPQAIQMYTMAANFAASRDPWENQALMREELALVLCNRSAAHLSNGEAEQALLDANLVVQYKAPWGKGHFRRAKALVALGRLRDARVATVNALMFEPQSQETAALLQEIDRELKKLEGEEAAAEGTVAIPAEVKQDIAAAA